MWQQFDCNAANASTANPTGCQADLFPWVEVTIGAGTNGLAQPFGFNDTTTKEGSTSMGFYNVLQGDAPYFKYLADHFAMSDNYHQAVMGGTGANHVMLGSGDAIWFSDGNGNAAVPPHNQLVAGARQTLASSTKLKIPIRSLEPTTGTPKTVTVAARTVHPPTAVERIRTVSTPPARRRTDHHLPQLTAAGPSIPTAKTATIIC